MIKKILTITALLGFMSVSAIASNHSSSETSVESSCTKASYINSRLER